MAKSKQRRTKKTPTPKRQFPNVQPVWTGKRWKFRARVDVKGTERRGDLRESQAQAYEDANKLRRLVVPSKLLTLADVMAEVLRRMKAKGRSVYTVRDRDARFS